MTRRQGQAIGPVISRRRLLGGTAAVGGAAAVGFVLSNSLRQAAAKAVAHPRRSRLDDIKHIVILMQENRSFDHYFGTFPGVRGFQGPDGTHASRWQPGLLPTGPESRRRLPPAVPLRHPDDVCASHARHRPHLADPAPGLERRADGRLDRSEGPLHDGVLQRGRHPLPPCAGPRLSRFATTTTAASSDRRTRTGSTCGRGWIDPDGTAGGPIIDNTPAFNNVILSWTTYPERLEQAGISWQVYQEEDNYDDNALAWFTQFANSSTSSRCGSGACVKQPAGAFEYDARKTGCPRCHGSSRPPRRPSIPTTSLRPGPSTSPRNSTPSPRTPTCGPRPCSSSPTTRTTGCSTTSRLRRRRPGPPTSS